MISKKEAFETPPGPLPASTPFNAGADNRLAVQYFVSLLAFTVLMVVLLLYGDWFSIQCLFVLLVVLIPWHHSAAILFFMVQATLLLHEAPIGWRKIEYNPFIVSLFALVFIALADRFRTSWKTIGDGTVRGLYTALLKFGESRAMGETQANVDEYSSTDPTASAGAFLLRIARMVGLVIITVFIAFALLVSVGKQPTAYAEWVLRPQELQAITLGLIVILTGVFFSHLVSLFFWRTLTPTQARVYLKSALADWLAPDAHGILRRKLKLRRRHQKRPK